MDTIVKVFVVLLIPVTVFSRLNAGPRINAGSTGPSLK